MTIAIIALIMRPHRRFRHVRVRACLPADEVEPGRAS
jgi:hypothetical protein